MSREDADRAVRDLDGKDLRGRPVRVAFDDSVSFLYATGPIFVSCDSRSDPVLIIIVVMNVAMIGEKTVIGTTVIKKKDIAVIAQGPPAVVNLMNVVRPGLQFLGERLTIKDLQGTMITGAEAMMTAERLIIILTAAGTIRTDAETTEDATTKTNALKRGRGTQMERDGRVSSICFQWSREEKTDGRLADCLFRLSDLCGVVVYTDRVLLMVNRWSASSKPRKEHSHLISRPIWGLRNCLEG